MGPPRWLVWQRRDLRLADHRALAAAAAATAAVTGVFVFDPAECQAADQAPARMWFMLESLRELKRRWQEAGSELLLLQGDPVVELPRLVTAIGAEVVAWNRDVEPAARERDRRVAAVLQAQGTKVLAPWDQLLVPPELLQTGAGAPYRVYGPYWRSWRRHVEGLGQELAPLPAPRNLLGFDSAALPEPAAALWRQLPLLETVPTAEDLGFPFQGADLCPCRPGEAAASVQLARFTHGPLFDYEEDRNLPARPGTSALSAGLRFGTLSPRQAWAAAQAMLPAVGSLEQRQSITVWEQELAWREFYQQALFHSPELIDGPYRLLWKHFPWENDPHRLQAWSDGLTGVPIVDAAMRQLRASGWMHNRCRMIVASYLVKDLICDWRLGERVFMELLVDGDRAANNGGWQWSASSGMDPRPLRIFNPATQSGRYDPEAAYIRTWLPELAHVAADDLISGAIAPLERRGYPAPLVNHREQQARFKALYATLPRV